jgi:SNF2 family DNA or RNA helicase
MWLGEKRNNKIYISTGEYNSHYGEVLKSLGARWLSLKRVFQLNLSISNILCIAENTDILLSIELRQLVQQSKTMNLDYSQPDNYSFKTKPYDYQIASFNFLQRENLGALFLEMGLGKSKIVIDVFSEKLLKKEISKILVIAPNSILEKWEREILQHSPYPGIKIEVLRGAKGKRLELLKKESHCFILNYESCDTLFEGLSAKHFDMIICDESTKIKNPSAKRSKALYKLSERIKYRYILTGQPVPRNWVDIFGQFKFLDPTILGPYITPFKRRYCQLGGFNGYQVVGYQNVSELKQLIYSKGIRFKKDDCLSLPSRTFVEIPLNMTEVQSKLYKEMKRDLMTEFKGKITTAAQVLTKIVRLSQITSGFLHNTEGDYQVLEKIPKIEATLELLGEAPEDKWVIWTNFVLEGKLLKSAIEKEGYSAEVISGEVKATRRAEIFESFQNGAIQNGAMPQILICQTSIGGLGLDMTAANRAIYYSNSYNLEFRQQSLERLHRIGQTKKVTYYDLLMIGSIDLTVLNCLKKKTDMAEVLLKAVVEEGG